MKLNKKIMISAMGLGTALLLVGCGSGSVDHKSTTTTKPSSTKIEHSQSTTFRHKSNSKKSVHKNRKQKNNVKTQPTQTRAYTPHMVTQQPHPQPKPATTPQVATNGLPTVNLGHGIVGTEDRGAGQEYITFNVDGKSYTIHGNDVQPGQDALTKARNFVAQHFATQQ